MMPANRKRRAFFRWRSADNANRALAGIGRYRMGPTGILGVPAGITKAMGQMPTRIFRKQSRGT